MSSRTDYPRIAPDLLSLMAAVSLKDVAGQVPDALPRHRHSLSRETVRASQLMRILAATAEVVAARGYFGTTVGAIVEAAGVSTKTFYGLYPDKEEAFLAAYSALDVVMERMREAALAKTEPRAMLEAGLRAFLETLAAEPAATRMFVVEATAAGPRVLRRRAQAYHDFASLLAIPLALARQRQAELPRADEATMLAVLGAINELVLQHLVEHDAATIPGLLPTAMTLVERVFLTPAS
ncbi:MAG: helix-turn-helix domain-containing protein [Candidatus Dormiibacterota bacterium]